MRGDEEEQEDWLTVDGSKRELDLWEGVTDITFKKFRVAYNRLAVGGMDHSIRFSVFSKVNTQDDDLLYGRYTTTI